jgi:hypothetical protein
MIPGAECCELAVMLCAVTVHIAVCCAVEVLCAFNTLETFRISQQTAKSKEQVKGVLET